MSSITCNGEVDDLKSFSLNNLKILLLAGSSLLRTHCTKFILWPESWDKIARMNFVEQGYNSAI